MRLFKLVVLVAVVAMAGCGGADDDIVGSWRLSRQLTFDGPCPSFDIPPSYDVAITRAADGRLTVTPTDGLGQAVDEDELMFATEEEWSATEGEVYPAVDWTLTLEDGALVGTAETRFYFDSEEGSTTCEYRWSVVGARQDDQG